MCTMRGRWLVAFLSLVGLAGCGGDEAGWTRDASGGEKLAIELVGAPELTYHAANGKTTVVFRFSARDGHGYPLAATELETRMTVDGRPLDVESVLAQDSTDLESSLAYGLVLDASYSMLMSDPPAFDPMLAAASVSVQRAKEIFARRAGGFEFATCWFNEHIYTQQGVWRPEDILAIPKPVPGSATKLYGAVEHMSAELRHRYDAGIAAGPNDSHVMVVFSDGADNYSYFDNAASPSTSLTPTGAGFLQQGWPATTLERVLTLVRAHPTLTVHVIGLGDSVADDELAALAEAGHGMYLKNPSATEIDEVFERITREFTTLHTHGATIPLAPADYAFGLEVRHVDGGPWASAAFRFHAGDANARVLP